MKEEWKSWFISQLILITGNYDWKDRSYSYTNIDVKDVPFHRELMSHICSLDKITHDSQYKVYHIHKWKVGDYFDEHMDSNFNRKWAYVCELQPSECDTSLVVDGFPIKEGVFSSTTLHKLPKIQKGTRISLTVFGVPYKTPI